MHCGLLGMSWVTMPVSCQATRKKISHAHFINNKNEDFVLGEGGGVTVRGNVCVLGNACVLGNVCVLGNNIIYS